jgi:RHS repeat-associated protein
MKFLNVITQTFKEKMMFAKILATGCVMLVTLCAYAQPSTPSLYNASNITETTFTVSWSSINDANVYQLQVSTNTDFTGATTYPSSSTSYTVSGRSPFTPYYYRVQAVNYMTGASPFSTYKTVTTALPLPAVPVLINPPINITTYAYTIRWNPAAYAADYLLDISEFSDFSTFVIHDRVVAGTSHTESLHHGKRYYYRVRSRNATGTSAYSLVGDRAVLTHPPTLPVASGQTKSSFIASWTAPYGANGYWLDVSTDRNFTTFLPDYHDKPIAGVSTTVSGLNEKTVYYFRVRALNLDGAPSDYCTLLSSALDLRKNFVREHVVQIRGLTVASEVESAPVTSRSDTYNFFDGLGRPDQTVSVQGSPLGQDIAQPFAYDALSRENVKYLPYVSATDGWYKYDFKTIDKAEYSASPQHLFYNGTGAVAEDEKPYSRTYFEGSPFNRPLLLGAPGNEFQPDALSTFGSPVSTDHSIKLSYEFNQPDEVLRWTWSYPPTQTEMGIVNAGMSGSPVYYDANELHVQKTKDEHNNMVIQYTDKHGRVVLKRVQSVTGNQSSTGVNKDLHFASTYYVYDDLGNLVCVIPPEATKLIMQTSSAYLGKTDSDKDTFLKRWAFRYVYDGRGRMIRKQVPGAELVYMVYDDRDRLVLTQDGNQRAGTTKYWTFTKYDLSNRPIATGIMESALSQVDIQTAITAHYNAMGSNKVWGERYVGADEAGNLHGYTNDTYPVTVTSGTGSNAAANCYLTVSYYDNYDFRSMWGSRKYVNDTLRHKVDGVVHDEQPASENENVVGQITGSKVKVIDNAVAGGYIWQRTVNYYDDRYRLIQVHADNMQGGVDRTSILYDFVGKVLVSKQFHNVMNWKSLVNVTASFGSLIRNSGTAGWNTSGASGQPFLAANVDGAFEFITPDMNVSRKAIGLSSTDPNAHYTTIGYCVYFESSGNLLKIYENGGTEKYVGTYAANDVFRIERTGDVVKYYKNGVFLYESLTASTGQLTPDVAFHNNGVLPYSSFTASSHPTVVTRRFKYDHAGRLTKTYHRLGQGELVNWTAVSSGIVATDGVISRTSGSAGWNAGAASSQVIPASSDGWLEARSPQVNNRMMIGLSDQDVGVNYSNIDYAIYFYSNGSFYVYESGSSRGIFGTYTAKDVFRIERIGQTIVYKKNQRVFYTSGVPSTSSLLADCSIYQIGGALDQVHIGQGLGSSYVLLNENQYNELGQLVDKKLHSANGAAAKQSIDHRYNIRGWLTSINDAALTIDGTDPKDYFGMELGYNEDIGSGNTEHDPELDASLVAKYSLNGNATDAAPGGINGTLMGAPQPVADEQGNSGQAYSFAANDYISIPGSQSKYAFVHNSGKFTISVFVKLSNIDARSMIIGNTINTPSQGFFLMYENYAGVADHQLRFSIYKPGETVFSVLGGIRTINDTNWHHVTVVGDGDNIRFYVDGRPDGSPQPISPTILSQGNATNNLTIAKVGTLSLGGSLDEVTILNRSVTPAELQLLQKREPITAKIDLRQYNGNISGVKWSKDLGLSDKKMQAYSYSYDAMNRLSTSNHKLQTAPANWTVGLFDENILSYDLNGNILDLQRTGQGKTAGARIDNLTYNYGSGTTASNKLVYVRDNTTDPTDRSKGFADVTATDYTYDANGNMLTDLNKNITAITYNYLNLPLGVTRGANSVGYTYDASGRKLMQTVTGGKKTYYSGEFVYENDVLQYVSHDEGRIAIADETVVFRYGFDEVNTTIVPATATTQTAVTINGEKYVQFRHTDTQSGQGPYEMGGAFIVQAGERYKYRVKGYRTHKEGYLRMVLGSTVVMGPSVMSGASSEGWVEMTVTVPTGVTTLTVGVSWPLASNDNVFFLNEFELIKLSSNAPEYQYNLKDHLGNVRLSFTTRDEIDKFTATFEDNTADAESKVFRNYSRVTNDLFDHTDTAAVYDKAQLLNGGNNSQIGVAKTFAVMPGDVVNAQAYARYFDATSSGGQVSNFGAALLGAFGAATPGVGEVGTASSALDSYGAIIEGLNGTHGTETVQGWLTILVFDKDFNLLVNDSDFDQLDDAYGQQPGDANKGPHDLLTANVNIKEPGYVFIYVSNEGAVQQDIYFDDITISHTKSPVIQIDDYYPFGLTFNSYQRENSVANQYLYNGKEKQDELNLSWLDYGFRMYDPAIARWMVIDPLAEKFKSWSPYSYAFNNPVRFTDFMGMGPEDEVRKESIIYSADVSHGKTVVTQTDVTTTISVNEDTGETTTTTATSVTQNTITVNAEGEVSTEYGNTVTFTKTAVKDSEGNVTTSEKAPKVSKETAEGKKEFKALNSWTKHIGNYNASHSNTWNHDTKLNGGAATFGAHLVGNLVMLNPGMVMGLAHPAMPMIIYKPIAESIAGVTITDGQMKDITIHSAAVYKNGVPLKMHKTPESKGQKYKYYGN